MKPGIGTTFVATVTMILLTGMTSACTPQDSVRPDPRRQAVEVLRDGRIVIDTSSRLSEKLEFGEVELSTTRMPSRMVTGTVVARLLAGDGDKADRWAFVDAELDEAYEEWRMNTLTVEFQKQHLARVKRLHEAKVEFFEKAVARMRELVDSGNEPASELMELEAELMEARIDAESEVFEAEIELLEAEREGAALARLLLQEGLHLEMLREAGEHAVIVTADVPEAAIPLVRNGSASVVHFYAKAGRAFEGRVGGSSIAVDQERRALRVFIEIEDEEHFLRPGMFADVGLNAELRDVLTVPLDAVLYLGRSSYVLVADDQGTLQLHEVRTGADMGRRVELTMGPPEGARVVGKGAILLRPFVERALRDSVRNVGS